MRLVWHYTVGHRDGGRGCFADIIREGCIDVSPCTDGRPIAWFSADHYWERTARVMHDAEEFVDRHTDRILKLAYSLFVMGSLDEDTTRKIYDGTIAFDVPKEFSDSLAEVGKTEWRLKA